MAKRSRSPRKYMSVPCEWCTSRARSTARSGRRLRQLRPRSGVQRRRLSNWIKRREVGAGEQSGVTSTEQARVKALERKVMELRRANEIWRRVSAYFAQAELDRPGECASKPKFPQLMYRQIPAAALVSSSLFFRPGWASSRQCLNSRFSGEIHRVRSPIHQK
jgi:transposase